MSPDEFTEVTQQSFGQRLGNAFKGILLGIVLFLAAFAVLLWNEGRAVRQARTLKEGAANTVSVASDRVDPANDGKPVHMTGKAGTKDILTDEEFGVSASAIRLQRKVEMFQWKENQESTTEKKLGGGTQTKTTYRYVLAWSDQPIDSSAFKQQQDHVNPPVPFASRTETASTVTIGAFRLPANMVDMASNFTPLTVAQDKRAKLPKNLRGRARLRDG